MPCFEPGPENPFLDEFDVKKWMLWSQRGEYRKVDFRKAPLELLSGDLTVFCIFGLLRGISASL